MSIIYVSLNYIPLNLAGAIRSSNFVNQVKRVEEVVILTTTKTQISDPSIKVDRISLNPPQNGDNYLTRLIKEIKFGFKVLKKIKQHNAGKIILSSPPFISALLIILLASNKNITLDVNDIYPEVYVWAGIFKKRSFFYRILKFLTKKSYQKSKHIVTATESIKRLIQRDYKIDNKKLTNIYTGYTNKMLKISESKYSQFTLICPGRLGEAQNVELLCKVMEGTYKKDKSINFLVIGSGGKENLIFDYQYDNLEHYMEVDHSDLVKIYHKCHIGLSFRNSTELGEIAFPQRVFEYIGANLPSVITPISEAGNIVEDNGLGYQFKNENLEDIIDHILLLKENKDLYNGKVKSIQSIKEKFVSNQNSKKIVDVINKDKSNF